MSALNNDLLYTRFYGSEDKPKIVILHGGPAAAGYMQLVGTKLGEKFRVLEPFQRTNCPVPLTVNQHIEDLKKLITHYSYPSPPCLLGHSWGAMLALAYATKYQDSINSLVLVGCGTFTEKARAKMLKTIEQRMTRDLEDQIENINRTVSDPDKRLNLVGKAIKPIYSFDPVIETIETKCNAKAHEQTWRNMLAMQKKGIYPQRFSKIKLPVLMLHGDYDPHPADLIHQSLLNVMPHMQYVKFANCGHEPWLDKSSKHNFFKEIESFVFSIALKK